jgi:hypothetical protein
MGDLPAFVTRSELAEYDLITFKAMELRFPKPEPIFLRGQLSLHANRPEINRLFLRCDDLGDRWMQELRNKTERLASGAHAEIRYMLLDEGCYSHAVFRHPSLRVLVTARQLGDRSTNIVAAAGHEIRFCPSRQLRASELAVCLAALARVPAADDGQQRAKALALQGAFEPVGTLVRISSEAFHTRCGRWIPLEHRICYDPAPIGADESRVIGTDALNRDVLYLKGTFYTRAQASGRREGAL